MAGYAQEAVRAGAAVVGGCCGSTPAHVEAMAAALGRAHLEMVDRPPQASR
jgi:methionine synthase I (cobalamin-dependent)